MKALKIVALIFVFLLSAAVGCAYLVSVKVERTAFNYDYYAGLMDEVNLAAEIHGQFEAGLRQNIPEEAPAEALDVLLGSFTRAFDAEWLDEQILVVIDDVLAYVDGSQDALTAVIDLTDNKARFKEELDSAIEALSPEEREAMQFVADDSEGRPGDLVDEMDLPDQLHLADLMADEEMPPGPQQAVPRIQMYRAYFRYVPYIIFALLLLACYLLAGLPGGLKWFGGSLALSGLILLIGVLALRTAFTAFMRWAGVGLAHLPIDLGIVRRAVEYTAGQVFSVPLMWTAFGVALAAGGIALGRFSVGAGETSE